MTISFKEIFNSNKIIEVPMDTEYLLFENTEKRKQRLITLGFESRNSSYIAFILRNVNQIRGHLATTNSLDHLPSSVFHIEDMIDSILFIDKRKSLRKTIRRMHNGSTS